MTNCHYTYNSHKVATKVIKACSTGFLIALLQACANETTAPIETITDADKALLEAIIDAEIKTIDEVA